MTSEVHSVNVFVLVALSGVLVVAWSRAMDRWMRMRTIGIRVPTLLIRDVIVMGLFALVTIVHLVVLVHAHQVGQQLWFHIVRGTLLLTAGTVWLYYEMFVIERH